MIHEIYNLKKNNIPLVCYIEILDFTGTWEVYDKQTEGIDYYSYGKFNFNHLKELIDYNGDAPSFIENEISKLGFIIN